MPFFLNCMGAGLIGSRPAARLAERWEQAEVLIPMTAGIGIPFQPFRLRLQPHCSNPVAKPDSSSVNPNGDLDAFLNSQSRAFSGRSF